MPDHKPEFPTPWRVAPYGTGIVAANGRSFGAVGLPLQMTRLVLQHIVTTVNAVEQPYMLESSHA